MLQCCLPRSEHKRYLAHLVGSRHWAARVWVLIVVRNSFQALPHPTSIRASVVRFNLNPVLMLCLFDGSSQGTVGFLIGRISVSLLESSSSSLYLNADVLKLTVGTTSSMHLLMKPMTEVVYSSMPLDESRNIFQSARKQSFSVASVSSDHFRLERVTGTSCFSFCL